MLLVLICCRCLVFIVVAGVVVILVLLISLLLHAFSFFVWFCFSVSVIGFLPVLKMLKTAIFLPFQRRFCSESFFLFLFFLDSRRRIRR